MLPATVPTPSGASLQMEPNPNPNPNELWLEAPLVKVIPVAVNAYSDECFLQGIVLHIHMNLEDQGAEYLEYRPEYMGDE